MARPCTKFKYQTSQIYRGDLQDAKFYTQEDFNDAL